MKRDYDLHAAMEILSGKRPERYKYERAIALYQFQAWVFAPDKPLWKRGGTLLAAKIIEREVKKKLDGLSKPRKRALMLKTVIKRSPFKEIYRDFLARRGGWSCLIRSITPSEVDRHYCKQTNDISSLHSMVDYRFRYIEHDGRKKNGADLEHGKAFLYSEPQKEAERKYPRLRKMTEICKTYKSTFPFIYIYVNNKQNAPLTLGGSRSVSRILKAAKDPAALLLMLRKARYVHDKLLPTTSSATNLRFPDIIQSTVEPTLPIEPSVVSRMEFFKTIKADMQTDNAYTPMQ